MILPYKIENIEKKDKPWLVLVNGLFADLQSWNDSVDYLTPHFRLLRYDGRGQGKGPRPLGPYFLGDLIDDLIELLDHLDIEQASFIGLSNGGRVAMGLAEKFPERVDLLVCCDSYDEVGPLLKAKLSSWLCANRIGGPAHRFDIATPWIWGETMMGEKISMLENYRQRAGLEKVHVIEALIEGAMASDSIDLSKIHSPLLLGVGEEDLLTPPFFQKRIVKKAKHGSVQVLKGGHASLLEYPENIENLILPWLLKRGEMNVLD